MLLFAILDFLKSKMVGNKHIVQKATAGTSCIILLPCERKLSTLHIHDECTDATLSGTDLLGLVSLYKAILTKLINSQ